jgi:predicted TIM-barrel fold metal-dependent hydrolase
VHADRLLRPLYDRLLSQWPGLEIFDCHTHVGVSDPSGFEAPFDALVESLHTAGARAAVFPLKDPAGYGDPNLAVAELAAASNGVMVAFCRIDPADDPTGIAERSLAAGARGIKLHPAGEAFAIDDPRLGDVYALADERRLPVLIHAGPELDGLGREALAICEQHPGLQMILAHQGLTDLGWLYPEVPAHPNLFFDTTWWGASHVIQLLALVPPGRVLSGSDLPYNSPLVGAFTALRCAMQAGYSDEQVRLVMGGQFERLVNGEPAIHAGPVVAGAAAPVGPSLEVLFGALTAATEALLRGEDPGMMLPIAKHACKHPPGDEDAATFETVEELLDLFERCAGELPQETPFAPGWDIVATAAVVARTPAVSDR